MSNVIKKIPTNKNILIIIIVAIGVLIISWILLPSTKQKLMNEVEWYQEHGFQVLDVDESWFTNIPSELVKREELSKLDLREKMYDVDSDLRARGLGECEIYYCFDLNIIFTMGFGPDETKIYIYYWTVE